MWHVVSSCSTFLPSIIKIFQRIFNLQSGHKIYAWSLSDITKRGKKGRVVILVQDTLSCPVLHAYQVPSKYSKLYSSYRVDTKSISNTKKRDNSRSKKELSFLYATHRLLLFYISTKCHQNIPKSIQVTEQTRSFTPMRSLPKTSYAFLHYSMKLFYWVT